MLARALNAHRPRVGFAPDATFLRLLTFTPILTYHTSGAPLCTYGCWEKLETLTLHLAGAVYPFAAWHEDDQRACAPEVVGIGAPYYGLKWRRAVGS